MILYCFLSRDGHVFFSVSAAFDVQLLLFIGLSSISFNMASVGGRRRRSAENQCAEFQARARQTIFRAGRKEVEDIMQNFLHSVNAFLGRQKGMKSDGE